MGRNLCAVVLLWVIAAVGGGTAEARRRPPPPPAAEAFDSRGWQLLGEQQVGGRVDRDRINVGRYEGQFSKLTVVVLDSELEMLDFTINFGDRTTYAPRLQHYFREGQRTRAFDLPPSARVIENIELRYRNLPGGGRARVQVWGLKTGDNYTPRPQVPRPPATAPWDSRGWTLLGEQQVGGRVDRDRINVGRYEGQYTKLMVVVLDSELEMQDFRVNFADRTTFAPRLQQVFREGQRTRAIDLPGAARTIQNIDLQYRNLPGGGRARVQVWGQAGYNPPPPPPPRYDWDSRGWTLLGEQRVTGRYDRDRIRVGRDDGRFTQLMVVVLDSDLELVDFSVNFGRGPGFRPAMSHYFREGSRTRSIDLPGRRRTIQTIDLRYRNLPGGGSARVQVWGR